MIKISCNRGGSMVSEEYKIAYSEVLEILKCVPKEEYEKIDKEKLEFYEKNKKQYYDFNYDKNKTLDEQGVSKIAKIIISIIYRDYWASNEERDKIFEMQNNMRKKLKDKMQIDFDPEAAFKKDTQFEEVKETSNEIIKVEKKFTFTKLINKIKRFLHIS